MNLSTESVPTVWTCADEAFFRITDELFVPGFLAGAGVLLASYDGDLPPVGPPRAAGRDSRGSVSASARATA